MAVGRAGGVVVGLRPLLDEAGALGEAAGALDEAAGALDEAAGALDAAGSLEVEP